MSAHSLFVFMVMYKISRAGAVLGEYDNATVRRYLDAGSIKLNDYGWTEGMSEWKQLHELGFQVSAPPVPPAAPATAPSGQVAVTSQKRPFAYSAWILAASLSPLLFSWRIIFDKTLGYSKGLKVVFGLWVSCFLLFIGIVLGNSEQISERAREARQAKPYAVKDNQEDPINAGAVMNIARNLIKGALKAPSTANFSDYSKTDWQKTYDDGTKQFYVVSGWVDSQNTYGAMIRANYVICFSCDGTNVVPSFVRLGTKEEGVIPEECKPGFK